MTLCRVVMRVDTMGRLGLAVIRHGAPVEGIHSGAALRSAEHVIAACIPLCGKTVLATCLRRLAWLHLAV